MAPHNHPGAIELPKAAIAKLEARLEPIRKKLASHPLYSAVQNVDDLRFFMQNHVFCVWDFMSLLKGLQRSLTCIDIPWSPQGPRDSRRLINEIVLGEESDTIGGRNVSHLELYLESMEEAGAETSVFTEMMKVLQEKGNDINDKTLVEAFKQAKAPLPAMEFCRKTFEFIRTNKIHVITSAFTFGREDLIPVMFTGLLKEMNKEMDGKLSTFILYLERHIEVDGEDHGPMSMQMMAEVCGGDNDPRWDEAADVAVQALQARVDIWDGVVAELNKRKTQTA